MSQAAPTTTTVRIELGADARLIRIVRLAARSLATDAGFRLDDLEDLALALDELVTATMAVLGDDGKLQLDLEADDLGVSVRGTILGDHKPLEIDDVSRSILDNAADRWTVGGKEAFHLVRLGPEVG